MTSTPFSRMIKLHRDCWKRVKGLKDRAPNLGIVVINVHPTRQEEMCIPSGGVATCGCLGFNSNPFFYHFIQNSYK